MATKIKVFLLSRYFRHLALLLALLQLGYLSLFLLNWFPLRYWQILGKVPFWDFSAIRESAICFKEFGFKVYEYSGDPCTGYTYGSSLLFILSRSLNLASPTFFGLTLMFLALLCLSILATPFGTYQNLQKSFYLYLFALLFSPPMILLFERGNLDSLVFIFVTFSGLLFLKDRKNSAFIVIGIATTFKFYTAPAFFVIYILQIGVRRGRVPRTLFLMTVISLIKADIERISAPLISLDRASFGIKVLLRQIENPALYSMALIFVLVSLMGIIGVVLSHISFFIKRPNFRDEKVRKVFLYYLYLSVLLPCYVFIFNFDYRLIYFVALCLAFVPLIWQFRHFRVLFQLLSLGACWFSFNSPPRIEIIGDICLISSLVIASYMVCNLLKSKDLNGERLYISKPDDRASS